MAMMIKHNNYYFEWQSNQEEFKEIYHEPYSKAYEKVFGKQFMDNTIHSGA
ncbi:MAG: hypothetical protein ACK5MA_05555 [Parachlamydiaceae bacterium]